MGLIHDIVAEAIGERAEHVEPVTGMGEINDVYFASTQSGEWVVRLGRDDESLDAYYKEQWCIEATAAIIPGPRVIAVGERDGRPFMVESRILGELAEHVVGRELEIWEVLGRYAARLGEVPVSGCGFHLDGRRSGVFRDDWPGIVDWYCDYLFGDDLLVRLEALSADDVSRVRDSVASAGEIQFTPRLNHGNFAVKNTIVGVDGVISVIDWGTAESGPGPHLDVAEVATWAMGATEIVAAFVRGCGLSAEECTTMRPAIDALILRRSLASVRWAHEAGHRQVGGFVNVARWHVGRTRAGESPFGIP